MVTTHRTGRSAMLVLALLLVASACGSGSDGDAGAGADGSGSGQPTATDATDATDPSRPSSEPTSPTTDGGTGATGSTTNGSDGGEASSSTSAGGTDAALAEVRRRLRADKLVAVVDGTLISDRDGSHFERPDDFAQVFPEFMVVDEEIVDDRGQPVCPDFELLAGDRVVVDVTETDGSILVTSENRLALTIEELAGSTALPRGIHDCRTGETADVPPVSRVSLEGEATLVTTTTPSGLTVVAEWGQGDTPLRLRTEAGTVLIDHDDLAYDYLISDDGASVYFTGYVGAAAAEPPAAVVAVDAATGAERWRLDLAGFPWVLDDRLVIEVVDPSSFPEFGRFATRELVVVEASTGAELDRFPFAGQVLGLY